VFTSNKIVTLALSTLLTLTAAGSVFATALQPSKSVKGGDNVLVAQLPTVSVLVVAENALGEADAIAQSQSIGGSGKSALAQSIGKATSLLGNAIALSSSTGIRDKRAIALSLAIAETVVSDALILIKSNAISGPGKPALVSVLSIAKSCVGNPTSVAPGKTR
jgi:hypothetical protein